MSLSWGSIVRWHLIAGCAYAVFFLHTAHAALVGVDEASDICAATADPCVIDETVEVVDGAILDFGTREVLIQGAGSIDSGFGFVVIRCGQFTANVTGAALVLSQSTPTGSEGGVLIVETYRTCSSDPTKRCLTDSACAAAGAGLCTLGRGNVALGGRVSGSADSPGSFVVRAAGNVDVTRPIQINGSGPEADGGSVEIEAQGSVTLAAAVSASGGGQAAGGDVTITAGGDIATSALVDVTGGDFDGGTIDWSAGRDIRIGEDINANSGAGGGFGGEITLDAGRDLLVVGGSASNKLVISADGHESFDSFGGDGGAHDYTAGRDIRIGPLVRITSNGATPDGFGEFITFSADGVITVEGTIAAIARGSSGGGGEVDLDADGVVLTGDAEIDVSGGSSGGGAIDLFADSLLDMNGALDASAGSGGVAGDVFMTSNNRLLVGGTVVINGSGTPLARPGATLFGCRMELLSGANFDVRATEARTSITTRKRLTIASGATLVADASTGANEIVYRSPEEPPLIFGSITPQPSLIVDSSLPACPICGDGELDEGETCEDGNVIGGDGCSPECQDEGCIADTPGWPNVALCDDGDACTQDRCDTAIHACEHISSCDDGIACTEDRCEGDQCVHVPDDSLCGGNPCADGVCDQSAGCVFTPREGPCDDGLFCNGTDSCANGACAVHSGNPCAGGPECRDGCDEVSDVCASASGTPCSDDGNPCTADICNGVGECIHPPNSAPCDDGVFCNGEDFCSGGGTCSFHTGNPCADAGECSNQCDETTRSCRAVVGAPCTDDGNPCTVDWCDASGTCVHAPRLPFLSLKVLVKRRALPAADRLVLKGDLDLDAATFAPDETGVDLEIRDLVEATLFAGRLPVGTITDASGTGRVYRFRDRTRQIAEANGIVSAIFRRDPKRSTFRIKLKAKGLDLDKEAILGALSLSLLFGEDPAVDACAAEIRLPCRGTSMRASCAR